MYTTKSVAGLFALAACVWSLQATATQIDLNPTVTNTNVGSSFTVDVVISGLSVPNPALAVTDFDLDISYDNSLLNATGVSFGTGVPPDISGFDLSVTGVVDVFAFSFADYATLRGLQGDSFTLVTLNFQALAQGTDSLAFVQNISFIVDLINVDGDPVNGANPAVCQSLSCIDVGGARVVIGPRNAVPEPNPLLLFAAATLALVIARRRHSLSR
jgi:hypothetical protein